MFTGTCYITSKKALVWDDGDGGGYRFVNGCLTQSEGFGSPHTTVQSKDPMHPTWMSFDVDTVRAMHTITPRGWRVADVQQIQGSRSVPLKPGEIGGGTGDSGWYTHSCVGVEYMFGRPHPPGRQCRAWRRHRTVFSFSEIAVLLFLASGALWLPDAVRIVRRRLNPIPVGCCQSCGYDLRGSPSAVCSECGTISSSEKRAIERD